MVKYSKNKFGSEVHYKIIFQWYIEFVPDSATGRTEVELHSPLLLNIPGALDNDTKMSSSEIVLKIFQKAANKTKYARALSGRSLFPQIKKIDINPTIRKYLKKKGIEDSFHKSMEMDIKTYAPLPDVHVTGRGINGVPSYFNDTQLAKIFNKFKEILYDKYPLDIFNQGEGRFECHFLIAKAIINKDVFILQ